MQSLLSQLEGASRQGKLAAVEQEPSESGEMPQQLIALGSLVKELGTQAHLIHVNCEAPYFFGVHAFLEEQYKEHQEQFDRVAELVRTLDTFMPMCRLGLTDALPCFHDIKSYEARSMLLTYMKNLEDCFWFVAGDVKQIWSMAHESKAILRGYRS